MRGWGRARWIAVATAALLAASGTLVGLRAAGRAPSPPAAAGTPSPTAAPPEPSAPPSPASLSPTPSPAPSSAPATPTPSGAPSVAPAVASPSPSPRPSVVAFRGLGAWVDLFDRSLDPTEAIADMRARGVRTLYLQTGRWRYEGSLAEARDPIAFPEEAGAWLDAAGAVGIRVVGWYVPGYGDLERDVRRTVAIASFRSAGGRGFAALGVDIEVKEETGGGAAFNDAIAEHLRRVRRAVGAAYPIAAITPPPLGMAIRADAWAGFPWVAIGHQADVIMPMAYWSYRGDCATNPDHCPEEYGRKNTAEVRRLTGLPVHAIGGVGDAVTATEVRDFVRGARAARPIGGSLYDYRTTEAAFWAHLDDFNA